MIKTSLENLIKAVDGFVVMTNDLDEVFNSMFNNKIPKLWETYSYPSLKPLGSYLKDLLERLDFFKGWILTG